VRVQGLVVKYDDALAPFAQAFFQQLLDPGQQGPPAVGQVKQQATGPVDGGVTERGGQLDEGMLRRSVRGQVEVVGLPGGAQHRAESAALARQVGKGQRGREQEHTGGGGAHAAAGTGPAVRLQGTTGHAVLVGEAIEVGAGQGHDQQMRRRVKAARGQQRGEPLQVRDRFFRGHAHGDANHQDVVEQAGEPLTPNLSPVRGATLTPDPSLGRGSTLTPDPSLGRGRGEKGRKGRKGETFRGGDAADDGVEGGGIGAVQRVDDDALLLLLLPVAILPVAVHPMRAAQAELGQHAHGDDRAAHAGPDDVPDAARPDHRRVALDPLQRRVIP